MHPHLSPKKPQQGLARSSGSPGSAHTDARGQTKTGTRMGHSAEGVPWDIWLDAFYSSPVQSRQHMLTGTTPNNPDSPSQRHKANAARRDNALTAFASPSGRPRIGEGPRAGGGVRLGPGPRSLGPSGRRMD